MAKYHGLRFNWLTEWALDTTRHLVTEISLMSYYDELGRQAARQAQERMNKRED